MTMAGFRLLGRKPTSASSGCTTKPAHSLLGLVVAELRSLVGKYAETTICIPQPLWKKQNCTQTRSLPSASQRPHNIALTILTDPGIRYLEEAPLTTFHLVACRSGTSLESPSRAALHARRSVERMNGEPLSTWIRYRNSCLPYNGCSLASYLKQNLLFKAWHDV
jgi:hypothetical protein